MAEGLAIKILGPNHEIQSAGSEPTKVNPFAIDVMKEIGIDISKNYSKSTDELSPKFLVELDCVITLCAEEVCPLIVSTANKIHWPFPDPAKQSGSDTEKLQKFKEVRDLIEKQLKTWKSEKSL